jgi:hypothetical protein
MLQKVFCYKQRLFDSNKANTVALKPHMVLHFLTFVIFFGSIKNYDTATSEHLHKGSKIEDDKISIFNIKYKHFKKIFNLNYK